MGKYDNYLSLFSWNIRGNSDKKETKGYVKVYGLNTSNASISVDAYNGCGDNMMPREVEHVCITNSNGQSIEIPGIDKLYDLLNSAINKK